MSEEKVGKLRQFGETLQSPFETQIIERYRRRKPSVEEALGAVYLAGVSAWLVEDITEALWGTRGSASMLTAIHAQEDPKAAQGKALAVAASCQR